MMEGTVLGEADAAGPQKGRLVGQRVMVVGNLATVRWGPGHLQAPPSRTSRVSAAASGEASAEPSAPPQPEVVEVVGIEYDDAGLGKHDGTYQGSRLFVCEDGYGSFTKLEKLELGVSIQRAVAEKYFAALLPEAASKSSVVEAVDAMEYTDSKGREKVMSVELIGRYGIEQRQSRLEGFVEMALANSCLCARYPEDVWEGDWCLPNLKSLWLDGTLLNDWSDIAAICELCPQLEWLSLSKTRLAPLETGNQLAAPRGAPADPCNGRLVLTPFRCRVQTLVLNGTRVTWSTLLAVDELGLFPQLQHLHLAHNRLTEGVPELKFQSEAEETRCPFPALKTLCLDNNDIVDWNVICRAVDMFPGLTELRLNANLLGENLDGLADMASHKTPRRLTAIFLSENRLGSWGAIGALSAYELLELRAQRIPLTEGDKPTASAMLVRQILIALMPTLLRLNASEVTVKERTAAERFFLTLVQQSGSPVTQGLRTNCDLEVHAARLKAIHGEVVGGAATEEAQASRSALMNSIVEVTLRPLAVAILDQPLAKKRVPHTMTVEELKRLSHALFKKVPLDKLQLVLSDPGLPFGFCFEDESRELGFYGVGDGAEIHVKDVRDQGA